MCIQQVRVSCVELARKVTVLKLEPRLWLPTRACDIQTLQTRRHNLKLCFLFQVVNGRLPFPNAPLVRRLTLSLRNSNPHLLVQPVVHSKAHQFSFFPHSISLWNQLPNSGPVTNRLLLITVYCMIVIMLSLSVVSVLVFLFDIVLHLILCCNFGYMLC